MSGWAIFALAYLPMAILTGRLATSPRLMDRDVAPYDAAVLVGLCWPMTIWIVGACMLKYTGGPAARAVMEWTLRLLTNPVLLRIFASPVIGDKNSKETTECPGTESS